MVSEELKRFSPAANNVFLIVIAVETRTKPPIKSQYEWEQKRKKQIYNYYVFFLFFSGTKNK